MDKTSLNAAEWRKSSYSSGNGQCVEVAVIAGAVALRDSKVPAGPVLVVGPGAFTAFVRGVAEGAAVRP